MEIEKAMSILIEEAKASLERTPELLPVLKEVGVVDSGGAGLLKVFEGFEKAVNGYVVEKSMPTVTDSNPVVGANDEKEEIEFSYITEFVLRLAENPAEEGKKVYVEKRFANVLASHWSKISIAQDCNLLMVHISTLFPGTILSYAQQFGEFARVKIENTTESDENIEVPVKEETKQKEPMKEYALIAVSAGDGLESMFKELNVDIVVSGGQTMNPSTLDFVEAIKKANAMKVFILPNNSNIIMATSQACQVTEEGVEARVIPTKTIPQGLVSCMMFSEEASMDENEEAMTEAIANVKTGQVTYAIKDTSVDGVEVKKDQYIALFGKQIVCCYPDKLKATKEMIAKMIDEMSSIVTIILGEDATDDEGEALASLIQAKHPDVEVEVRRGNQPVYSFIIGVE